LFWVYQRYLKKEEPRLLLFKVERGGIQETVKVRGEVVAEKEFDLEFPALGIVKQVFVSEGQQVGRGAALMKLDTTDLELDIKTLDAKLNQGQANLEKLIAGSTAEDLKISETKVNNARVALEDAKRDLVNRLQDAYTKSDDAIRNKTDQFFSNPRSSNPELGFLISDVALKADLERQRLALESLLTSWQSSLSQLTVTGDLVFYVKTAKDNLAKITLFLEKAALAVNSYTNNTWKSDTATARTNVNTATTNLIAADEKLKTAESSLAIAQDELTFKKAGTRTEDIAIAKAQIEEIKGQIDAVKEKIIKSTLYAPSSAKITKVWLEPQEVFRPGKTAISLSTSGHKIQADVSELDIGKIREINGNEVSIELDAFPEQKIKGRVTSVEPKEIIKEGDKYFRINVFTDPHGLSIRSGMTADLVILISFKNNVLKIPELAVDARNDKKFAKITVDGVLRETEIETGISDGEFIEIVSGLQEGQTVAVSAD